MPEIFPKMARAELNKSARETAEGKGGAPLPSVTSDAQHVKASDNCGYAANRDLAEMIAKAVESKKNADEHGPHFVLGWRLYPNKDHPRWNDKDVHSCGCGCGCSA